MAANASASDLLSAYYGIVSDTPQAEGEEPPKPAEPVRTKEEQMDLNGDHFMPKMYVDSLLAKNNIRGLKEHSKLLTDHIRSLDSEMQMLVYQNYNRFISATDMIRQMKTNVEAMEEEMGNLVKSMDQISICSQKIETKLAPNRGTLDNLVGVNRLLKRVRFLFELPSRLNKSIEAGAHAQAVKYFLLSNRFLKQKTHIPSFEKIRIESEHIINHLKVTLGNIVKDPSTSPDVQMENAALLMELDAKPDHLLHDIFESKKTKFLSDLKRSVAEEKNLPPFSLHTLSKLDSAEKRRASVEPEKPLTSPPKEKGEKEKKEKGEGEKEKEKADQEKSLLEPEPLASPKKEGKEGKKEGKEKEKEKKAKEEKEREENRGPPNLLTILDRNFIQGFSLFASAFLDAFVAPKAAHAKTCEEGLLDFSKEVFSEYFNVVRVYLTRFASSSSIAPPKRRGSVSEGTEGTPPKEGLRRNSSDSGVGEDLAGAAVRFLTHVMFSFYQSISHCAKLVPRAKLLEKGVELLEFSTRSCVETVLEGTKAQILSVLTDLHSDVVLFQQQKKTVSAKIVGVSVREAIEGGVLLLVPLLSTKRYEEDRPTTAAIKKQTLDFAPDFLEHILQWLVGVVSLDSSLETNPLSSLSAVAERSHPIFWMFLSHMMSSFENTHLAKLEKFLLTRFPDKRPQPVEVATVVANLRIHYVETHAALLSQIVRDHLIQNEKEVKEQESLLVKNLVSHLKSVCTELSLLFPQLPQLKIESQVVIHAGEKTEGLTHITRLFREKVQIVKPVLDTPVSLCTAVVRSLLKSLIENVRTLPRVTQATHAHIQAEVCVLRAVVGGMLASGGKVPPAEKKEVETLLDEILWSASDRCSVEPVFLSTQELHERKNALLSFIGL